MSLRPPSTSPSPSPGPHNGNPRASLQPQPRGTAANAAANLAPIATRREFTPGARPTSELLSVGPGAFQTPESEAIDQWFENLQNYEATLEEMAAASLDVNFKEELSAIEQWFRVLSEAERTAALYSLLQHSTQVQIRFFITVLQQMARSDPMTALLSPAMGSSMQSQMEAKLASMGLKSPGLPQSPMRNSFGPGTPTSASRQSLSVDPSTYLSPDSASKGNNEAAAQLAQQRARLKANNHRLSAPGPLISEGGRPQSLWSQSSLAQVAERAPSPATSDLAPSSASVRPKSTDFTGLASQFARSPRQASGSVDDTAGADLDLTMQELRLNDQLSPMVGGNWASMVNTPMVPMFGDGNALGGQATTLDAAASKLANWNMGNGAPTRGIVLDDAKKFKRDSKGPTGSTSGGTSLGPGPANGAPKTPNKDDGNSLAPPTNKWKANSSSSTASGPSWRAGNRSPSNAGSARFGGSDAGSTAASSFTGGPISPAMGLGMGMGGFGGMYGGMGMGSIGDMANLQQQQQALQNQMIAAQLGGAFSPQLGGGFPNNPMAMGMGNFGMGMGMGVQGQPGGPNNRPPRGGARTPGAQGSASARGGAANKAGRPAAKPKAQLKDDDINITLLNDIPTWFHTLRLHKYTPVVQGKNWKDLVIMNDKELEELGISALGARRKLLKHFVVVRNKFDIPHPEGAETGAEASDDDDDGAGGVEER
ncbi:hypothetical protein M407DRAFT_244636 [Tulasnella calospora MUT 4182]|uniref:SAM domain-containing protein n=1 Tax=Tulasnella calospora MUT 4182 TaxID=1051891 RepID=A0A0C3LR78_9AGAM|nr:hypothetical protein M407DRAFT_244636 [Tulasnella calospora MUT 4182]